MPEIGEVLVTQKFIIFKNCLRKLKFSQQMKDSINCSTSISWNTTQQLVQFSPVPQSCPTLWLIGLQHARIPCLSPTSGAHSNTCPLTRWCHPTFSSSIVPFSSCLQGFQASGSFPISQLFASGGQSIGVSASASGLSVNVYDWFPLGLTGWSSLQSKGLSRVFSNTINQRHQFFGTQLSL